MTKSTDNSLSIQRVYIFKPNSIDKNIKLNNCN